MARSTLDSILTIKNMAKAPSFGKTAKSMKANGSMAGNMAKEPSPCLVAKKETAFGNMENGLNGSMKLAHKEISMI
jgi:hypothetical protein